MVDLSLASSYLPAFVCLAKALLATALALVALPAGGLPLMCVLVQLDRLFLNTDFIFDVNALLAFVVAFTATHHDRALFGATATTASLAPAVAALWALVALAHLARPYLRPRMEIVAYAALAAALSLTHQPRDTVGAAFARAAAYTALTLAHIYWHAATNHDEPLALTATRFGAIMLGSAPVAVFTALGAGVALAAKWNWRDKPPAPPPHEHDVTDVEANTLRELLASRKEKGGS